MRHLAASSSEYIDTGNPWRSRIILVRFLRSGFILFSPLPFQDQFQRVEERTESLGNLEDPKKRKQTLFFPSGTLGNIIRIYSVSQSTNIHRDPHVSGIALQGFSFTPSKRGSSRAKWLYEMSGAEVPRFLQVSSIPKGVGDALTLPSFPPFQFIEVISKRKKRVKVREDKYPTVMMRDRQAGSILGDQMGELYTSGETSAGQAKTKKQILSLHYCHETVKTLQFRLVPEERRDYDLMEFKSELEKTQN